MPEAAAPVAVDEHDRHALTAQIAQDAVAEVARLQRDGLRALFPDRDSDVGLMAHVHRVVDEYGSGIPGYDEWMRDCVLDLTRVFVGQGHTEESAVATMDLFGQTFLSYINQAASNG